jgi:hypothetical protein
VPQVHALPLGVNLGRSESPPTLAQEKGEPFGRSGQAVGHQPYPFVAKFTAALQPAFPWLELLEPLSSKHRAARVRIQADRDKAESVYDLSICCTVCADLFAAKPHKFVGKGYMPLTDDPPTAFGVLQGSAGVEFLLELVVFAES